MLALLFVALQAAPVDADSGWFKALVIAVIVIAIAAGVWTFAYIVNLFAGRRPPNP